ncbi:MAG: hypothetical protein UMV23_02465 [Halanaerobium sp.]|nr:hypothetical protein [Halanaerobium sp.]
MKKKQVVCLIGSTRGSKTTSESIVDYLQKQLANGNIQLKKFRVCQVFALEEEMNQFIAVLAGSDMLLLSSPLYVDSLPYPVLGVMEELSRKIRRESWSGKEMMAIIHSGYPEPIQRKACLDICRCFAEEMGLKWLGGIGFGGTSIIGGQPLEEMGRFSKWLRKALEEMAPAIIEGEPIPARARETSHKNFLPLPKPLLKVLLNAVMRRTAKKKGIDIYARPYESKRLQVKRRGGDGNG